MPKTFAIVLGVGLAIAVGTRPALPQAPHRKQLAEKFQRDLQRATDAASGVVGVAVVDLSSGDRFGVNEQLLFPQGSAIKIPILIELFRRVDRGDLRLGDRIPVRAADQVGGSGLLQHFADLGSELSLHDLAVPMIVLSDNTATNMLIDKLGMERITQTMAELGAPQTRLQRKMIRPEDSAKGNENVSTPREAVDLMVRLAKCDLPMTANSCAEVKRILEIPKSGAFREPIASSVPVAWKPGGIEGVQTAWGLVGVPGGPYAISVMVNYGPDDTNPTLREISALAYRYFTQVARTTPHGTRVPMEYIKKSGLEAPGLRLGAGPLGVRGLGLGAPPAARRGGPEVRDVAFSAGPVESGRTRAEERLPRELRTLGYRIERITFPSGTPA